MGRNSRRADETIVVTRPPASQPAAVTRRPPEPIRPIPAHRTGISLLQARVRRTRRGSRLYPSGW